MSADKAELLSVWSSLQLMWERVPMRRSPLAPHLRHRGTLDLRRSQCPWFPVSPYLNDPTLSHDSSPECKLYWNHVNHVAHVFHIGKVGMETPCWEKKDVGVGQLAASQNIQLWKCFIHQWLWWPFLYLCYINQQLYEPGISYGRSFTVLPKCLFAIPTVATLPSNSLFPIP